MYLIHHGIKGQKWGVRRFENEDGTLTEEGKRRYRTFQGDDRAFEKEYSKKAVDLYNKASEEMNRGVFDTINKEYEQYTTVGKDYVRETSQAWKDIYTDVLLREIGLHKEQGKAWVENAFMYNMFDNYLPMYEDEYSH